MASLPVGDITADIFFKKNACMKDAFPQFSQTIVSAFDMSTCSPSCLGGIPFG
jgi:hypothetical protein|tara:strand:- start:49 stop:207 length:159 start_codon:yes stop_codon:yes gene_type:complete